ncbi:site-specific DNA-methyltransferase, partial [bacterium]|nr:site-specific DNA-methyltransferase [bacterium]
AEEIITAFSTPRGVCFEPFCGSGSQVLAAERSDRICCGMELDPAYVDVAVRRWEAFTGQTATLDGNGRTFAELSAERLPMKAA